MATSTFTTWRALRDQLKDNIAEFAASNHFITKSYTQPDGVTVSFQSIADMLRALQKVETLVKVEDDPYNRPKHRPLVIRSGADK